MDQEINILSLFEDVFGYLWIGTYDGLNFLSADNLAKKNFQFQKYFHKNECIN